jgi:hypothetical protein
MFERSLAGDLKGSLASLYNSEKYDIVVPAKPSIPFPKRKSGDFPP